MKLSIVILTLLLSTPTAYGKVTCKSSPYKMVDTGVPFGTPTKNIKKLAKKSFKKANIQFQNHENVVFVAFNPPYKNMDKIAYFSIDGVVTRILFGYHKSMIQRFGGTVEALKAMLTKLKSQYGEGEVKSEGSSKVSITYSSNGASLTLIADDSDKTIMLRYDCDSLEEEIRAKQAKNTNFGF
jgi:hypothetical protein